MDHDPYSTADIYPEPNRLVVWFCIMMLIALLVCGGTWLTQEIREIKEEQRIERPTINMKITIGEETEEVELINDYGEGLDGTLFLIGHEYGWSHLVNAQTREDAEDAWLDQAKPLEENELYTAYGYRTQKEFEDRPEDDEGNLAEGYRYQPNFTGTGVVYVGDHHRVRKVELEGVTLSLGD